MTSAQKQFLVDLSKDISQLKLALKLKQKLDAAKDEEAVDQAFLWALTALASSTEKKATAQSKAKPKKAKASEGKKRDKKEFSPEQKARREQARKRRAAAILKANREKNEAKQARMNTVNLKIQQCLRQMPPTTNRDHKKKWEELEALVREKRNIDEQAWAGRKKGKGTGFWAVKNR